MGDEGCGTYEDEEWIHRNIDEATSRTVGIDINEESLEELSEQDYEVYFGNAEEFQLDEVFDVIFAGALIEHLSNPGKFLGRAKEHLKENGRLILTTPNYHSAYRIKNRMFNPIKPEEELNLGGHVVAFTIDELRRLLMREGFEIVDYHFAETDNVPSLISKILNRLLPNYLKYHIFCVSKPRKTE